MGQVLAGTGWPPVTAALSKGGLKFGTLRADIPKCTHRGNGAGGGDRNWSRGRSCARWGSPGADSWGTVGPFFFAAPQKTTARPGGRAVLLGADVRQGRNRGDPDFPAGHRHGLAGASHNLTPPVSRRLACRARPHKRKRIFSVRACDASQSAKVAPAANGSAWNWPPAVPWGSARTGVPVPPPDAPRAPRQ